jgi:hypothetical protein
MSAFFEWDTEPVKAAILAELGRQKCSVKPDDYSEGFDQWSDPCVIKVSEHVGKEFFTEEWDVNIWDDEGTFTVTAYPVYDGERCESAWLTLIAVPFGERS